MQGAFSIKNKECIVELSKKLQNQFGFTNDFAIELSNHLYQTGHCFEENGLVNSFLSNIDRKTIPMYLSLDEWKLISKKLYETKLIDKEIYDIAMNMTNNISKVVTMSCMQALEYVVFNRKHIDNFAIISIQEVETDGNGFTFDVSGCCKGVLNLRFSDVNPAMFVSKEDKDYLERQIINGTVKLFDEEDAKKIKKFVDNMNKRGDVQTLLIHCAAGVSRSPAVAAAICQYLFGNDGDFFEKQVPNKFVYDNLLKYFTDYGV